MTYFNSAIGRINFKKVIIVYIITAVAAGILSLGFLGFTFKDKLALAFSYNKISKEVLKSKDGLISLKSDLILLAKNKEIVDILILNNENDIVFSAKNSPLAQNGSLNLESSSERGSLFLSDKENPNVAFRLVNNHHLLFSLIISDDDDAQRDYINGYFFEKNFNTKQVYLLSFVLAKTDGSKVYFISDIRPVSNGDFYLKAVKALAMLFFMIYWVIVALWVYANALKSKKNAAAWGIATLCTNLAGLFLYLIYRQGTNFCSKCGLLQNEANLYCSSCGAKLGETCNWCNAAVGLKDSFCKSCGSKINRMQDENEK